MFEVLGAIFVAKSVRKRFPCVAVTAGSLAPIIRWGRFPLPRMGLSHGLHDGQFERAKPLQRGDGDPEFDDLSFEHPRLWAPIQQSLMVHLLFDATPAVGSAPSSPGLLTKVS